MWKCTWNISSVLLSLFNTVNILKFPNTSFRTFFFFRLNSDFLCEWSTKYVMEWETVVALFAYGISSETLVYEILGQ